MAAFCPPYQMGPLRCTIITHGKEQQKWGLERDTKVLVQILREFKNSLKDRSYSSIEVVVRDPQQPPAWAEINIHLEIPCRAAFPFGTINVVMVNPEWWYTPSWNWVYEEADYFMVKYEGAVDLLPPSVRNKTIVIPWRPDSTITASSSTPKREFVCFLGNSDHKAASAETWLPTWKTTWPSVHVYGDRRIIERVSKYANQSNIHFETDYLSAAEKEEINVNYLYHICCSEAEGFGHILAEAMAVGRIPIWSRIPAFESQASVALGEMGAVNVFRTDVKAEHSLHPLYKLDPVSFVAAVETALKYDNHTIKTISGTVKHAITTRVAAFRVAMKRLFKTILANLAKKPGVHGPLQGPIKDPPFVGIVTLTYNRPEWFALATYNLLQMDYPPEKMVWCIVDDSDSALRVDEKVARFQSRFPQIIVHYVSLSKKTTVGAKRNAGVNAIHKQHPQLQWIMHMDDDDVYPKSSIRDRLAWLLSTGARAIYCSTLPMYDTLQYVSAVNVPPLQLAPSERVSEASMAYSVSMWKEHGFPTSVQIAEGEAFIAGREAYTVEIPPSGIIVALQHGKNLSSRSVPKQEPNGCHFGFSDELFTLVHKLAGTPS